MKLPSFIYRSERVGRNGRAFSLLKFRTLKEGFKGSFATDEGYTKFGKFLRKTKLDEVLQLFNVLKREMSLVGVRPEGAESLAILPRDIRKHILSQKPGLTSLSSIAFFEEEKLLKNSSAAITYHAKIRPIKLVLDSFYVDNKCFLLDLAILWMTLKLVIKSFFRK